jgi:hypothetical protein
MSSIEWTLRRLVGVLLVAQAAFHLAFLSLAPTHPNASPLQMYAWHVAASALSVAVLRHCERTLVRIVAHVALHRISAIVVTTLVFRRPSHCPTWQTAGAAGPSWQRSPLLLRGPPAAA